MYIKKKKDSNSLLRKVKSHKNPRHCNLNKCIVCIAEIIKLPTGSCDDYCGTGSLMNINILN